MKKGTLFEALDNKKVRCRLCPHYCSIQNNSYGICRVRKNINGELFSLNSDKIAAVNSDPIEKKPLYHFLPDTTSLSIAAMGCNFNCKFCQNHSLSMVEDENGIYGENIAPEDIVDMALGSGSQSISYTYTEPTIYFELMYETAKIAKEQGLKNVMVTNGFISPEALEMILPFIDGANIDLKAFSDNFYRSYCGGKLDPVLDSIKIMAQKKVWIELTTLLIPDLNTDHKELKELISFILDTDASIPWHVSRFFPNYKVTDKNPTDIRKIEKVLETGKEMGLKYIYGGNFSSAKWENTYCHKCNTMLIERSGYSTKISNLKSGKCANCGENIPGVWA
ncbi:MAG: AmmeMemoRadiSam system radical SAM enzyme [Acidobacteriota bacterium]